MDIVITLTTSSKVKQRILHIMRDADLILRVKTGEPHADVLITDVIEKNFIFRK